jgi:hypothetical protein
MTKTTKIILAVCAGLLVLCCGALAIGYFFVSRTIGQSVAMSPAEMSRVGHEIADYSLPAGYVEKMAISVLGMKIVGIGPSSSSDNMMLMLMQIPTTGTTNQEELERQMRQAWDQQGSTQSQNYTVVGTREVTVRGEKVILTISEASSQGESTATRQEIGVFTGKSEKMVMFMAMGDKESFDENVVDEFLGSIREKTRGDADQEFMKEAIEAECERVDRDPAH